jgi:hypothetical protein
MTTDKITIRHVFYGGSGTCYIVCLNGDDVATLSNGWPHEVPLLALVMKYKDMEAAPAAVVGALRRYKANWGKNINPKLPHAPLPHEQIQLSSWAAETGWDYVVIKVTARHPGGDCWQQTLRSPHYSKREWATISHFLKKRHIGEAEFSRLRQIAGKEKGPLEIKMQPYDHYGWRGKSA